MNKRSYITKSKIRAAVRHLAAAHALLIAAENFEADLWDELRAKRCSESLWESAANHRDQMRRQFKAAQSRVHTLRVNYLIERIA